MMKYVILFILIILFSDCYKEDMGTCSCSTKNLVIIEQNRIDLQKFVIRPDTSTIIGHCNAIKEIPNKGAIEWKANNYTSNFSKETSIFFTNFSDTTWRNIDPIENSRENIFINIKSISNLQLGKQKIFDSKTHILDPNKPYAGYSIWDSDILHGSWAIDTLKENILEITKLDTMDMIIEGTFSLNFKWDRTSPVPKYLSEEVNFRCGKFRSKIY
jgi:hypothetical protein